MKPTFTTRIEKGDIKKGNYERVLKFITETKGKGRGLHCKVQRAGIMRRML